MSSGLETVRMVGARRMKLVFILLGVILAVAAISGGILLSNLLWFLLILALVVFAIGALTGRITE